MKVVSGCTLFTILIRNSLKNDSGGAILKPSRLTNFTKNHFEILLLPDRLTEISGAFCNESFASLQMASFLRPDGGLCFLNSTLGDADLVNPPTTPARLIVKIDFDPVTYCDLSSNSFFMQSHYFSSGILNDAVAEINLRLFNGNIYISGLMYPVSA